MSQRFNVAPMHLALVAWVSMPSRLLINKVLWAAALLLQCALVVVLFRRGIARKFPCFAALICFYPLRAGLLMALAGRIDADAYTPLVTTLAFTEVLLQALVAIELAWRIAQQTDVEPRSSIRRGSIILLIALAVAGGLSWLVINFLPANASADRVQVFVWFVMMALFAAARRYARATTSINLVRITAGFAAFSLIQLATLIGRSQAFARHDASWYLAWSYTPAIGYLAVVIFWLIALKKEQRSDAAAA